MSARQDAAQVLTEHAAHAIAAGKIGCACYHPEWMTRAEHAKHQADMLAAAGLLVTPEHDAQVAAGAPREAAEAIDSDSFEVIGAPREFHQGMQSAVDRLRRRADRIERQEGE